MRIAAQQLTLPESASPPEQTAQRASSSFLELLSSVAAASPASSGKGIASPTSRFSIPSNPNSEKQSDDSADGSIAGDSTHDSNSSPQSVVSAVSRQRTTASLPSLQLLPLVPLRSTPAISPRLAIRDDKPQLNTSALAAKIAASVVIPFAGAVATAAQAIKSPADQTLFIPVPQTIAAPSQPGIFVSIPQPQAAPAQSAILSASVLPATQAVTVPGTQPSILPSLRSVGTPVSQTSVMPAAQSAPSSVQQPVPSTQNQAPQPASAESQTPAPAIDPAASLALPVAATTIEPDASTPILPAIASALQSAPVFAAQPASAPRTELPSSPNSPASTSNSATNISLPLASTTDRFSFTLANASDRIPAPAVKSVDVSAAQPAKTTSRATAPALDQPFQPGTELSPNPVVATPAPAASFVLPEIVLVPFVADSLQPVATSTQSGKASDQVGGNAIGSATPASSSKSNTTAPAPASPASSTHVSAAANQPERPTSTDSQQPAPVSSKSADAGPALLQPVANSAAAHDAAPRTRTADAADAPRAAGQPLPAQSENTPATGSINTARLIQTMSESEMRVGMHSAEFGDISIRTMVSPLQMTAQISVDHGDLGKAISAHIPTMQEKLGGELGLKATVEVNQSGMSFAGDRGYSAAREQRPYAPSAITETLQQPAETDSTVTRISAIPSIAGDRLDIRA